MASPFGTCGLNKPAPAAFATNKHLSLLSPPPALVSIPRRMQTRPQRRRCRFTVSAAKELHFNKDGSAIRKLQVAQLANTVAPLLFISCHFFSPFFF
jgi:chaperonin GroEL